MAIITLTTDLGVRDHYVAILKGVILNKVPQATIVDISHEIAPFDLQQAAFILKNAFHYFPAGTTHLVSVHAEHKRIYKCVAIAYKGHYFTGLDNGLFSLIFDDYPEKIIELPFETDRVSTFIARDILGSAAADLAKGIQLEQLGKQFNTLETRTYLRPPDNHMIMKGSVSYVDRFGNVITNISKERFEKLRADRQFIIIFKKNDEFHEISKTYSDVQEGEKLVLFNSSGFLEIAINKGNASELLGLHIDDTIQIEFE